MTILFNNLVVKSPSATVVKEDNGKFRIVITFLSGSKMYTSHTSLPDVQDELRENGVKQTDPLSYLY